MLHSCRLGVLKTLTCLGKGLCNRVLLQISMLYGQGGSKATLIRDVSGILRDMLCLVSEVEAEQVRFLEGFLYFCPFCFQRNLPILSAQFVYFRPRKEPQSAQYSQITKEIHSILHNDFCFFSVHFFKLQWPLPCT